MSKKMIFTMALLLSVTGFVVAQEVAIRQTQNQEPARVAPTRFAPEYTPRASQWSQFAQRASTPEQNEEMTRRMNIQENVQRAMAALKNSDSDTRENVKSDLKKALGEEYDMLLADYDKNLDRLAKQLAEMQEKLDRRKEAKDDMIKLRMQVLEAQADDLGWPGQSSGTFFTGAFDFGSGPNHFGSQPRLAVPRQPNSLTSPFRLKRNKNDKEAEAPISSSDK